MTVNIFSGIPVATIDGPTASGKGTASRCVAQRVGWHFLDSGVLYRALALAAIQATVSLDDEAALARLADSVTIEFRFNATDTPTQIVLNGQEVTKQVRTEQIAAGASTVSRFPAVRAALLDYQRRYRCLPGLIADGRDMGTVVFPDAPLKIFLTARPDIRAERRYRELKGQGIDVRLDALIADIKHRDEQDRTRRISPLVPAQDAVLIDTSDLSSEQVVTKIMTLLAEVFRL